MIELMLDASDAREASIVLIAPHPDDESIAMGGLIQIALSRGAHVTVVLLTDGDNNPWPQRALERRLWIGSRARASWGRRRREEVGNALRILGVPDSSVRHLGLPDLGVTGCLESDLDATVEKLCDVFRDVAPTVVVSPSLSDTHPDHSAAHVMCRLALATCGSKAQWLSYTVHGTTDASASECALDSRTRELKRRAVGAYHTQLVLSRKRIMAYADRPERFVVEQAVPRANVSTPVQLPWRISRLSATLTSVILIANNRVWQLAIEAATSAEETDGFPRCARDSAGQLSIRFPEQFLVSSPAFAKLASRLASPWIYDRWGWTRIDGQ